MFRRATLPKPREIAGFPGYLVSVHGDVTSTHYHRGTSSRTLRPGLATNGYLTVALRRDNRGHTFTIHALVMGAFGGPKPGPGFEIRHHDGNRYNNHAANLLWGTRADNMADMKRHGRKAGAKNPHRGSAVVTSRLTEADALVIKQRLAAGDKQADIAATYGVTRSTITTINAGRAWRHVQLTE